jgi:hypothetical protein
MFLGHYAVALAARRAAPGTSLGTLVFAAQFADLLWPVLLLTGVERVEIVPGLMAANSLDFVSYPITHSLLMAVLWAILIGGAHVALRRRIRGGLVIAALVVSHWLLDAPMHRPDLPLYPGSDTLVGGGLWHSVAATVLLELGLLAAGLAIYLRGSRPLSRIGRAGPWVFATVLVAFFLTALFGPLPTDTSALAFGALGLWLFVPLAWWLDRHRTGASTALPAVGRPDHVAPLTKTAAG